MAIREVCCFRGGRRAEYLGFGGFGRWWLRGSGLEELMSAQCGGDSGFVLAHVPPNSPTVFDVFRT